MARRENQSLKDEITKLRVAIHKLEDERKKSNNRIEVLEDKLKRYEEGQAWNLDYLLAGDLVRRVQKALAKYFQVKYKWLNMIQLEGMIPLNQDDNEFQKKLTDVGLSTKEQRNHLFQIMMSMSEQRNEAHPFGEGELPMSLNDIKKKFEDMGYGFALDELLKLFAKIVPKGDIREDPKNWQLAK